MGDNPERVKQALSEALALSLIHIYHGEGQAVRPTRSRGAGIWREALGVILFFAGLLLLYFLFSNPTTGAGQAIVRTARALAGNLCWALPLLLGWAGVLVAFSGKARSMKPSRVILIALLFLLVMTVVHVFSADRIMEGARLFNYETFLQRSWQYQDCLLYTSRCV